MALNTITYTNKVALNVDPSVAEINKVTDANMNEIKTVVNDNATLMGDLTTLTTTSKTSCVSAINEVDGDIGTLTNLTTTSQTNCVSAINEVNGKFTYSTTESEIGKWIDGKVIYRKVVNIGSLPSSGSKNTAHSISNLDKVVQIYGFASSGNVRFPLPYTTNTNSSNIALYANTTNVVVEVGQDRSGYSGYAILEYTKTS